MPTQTDSPSDLERRKQVKVRLRRDLVIETAKYEGKRFFVLKDPVSLRYYRLKENEHFLLKYLDGKDTLEDAQRAYEEQYRPERLKLEDLESFAQQLIKAGLAQNESPKAGKLLFENRKKRKRSEWMQTLTNILYIKVPLIDPDRILKRMQQPLGWIFSLFFFLLSVGLMLSAALLVATHFQTFRSKLPDYHEFFSFKTVGYLWVALAVVKVIHEFGHGLSCKRFGGEVHEMGLLFLCLSPAMYCNVSDAWTLPNKWHRIIISFAGIYVELLIASIATFVWWNTPSQPFINNLSLSLMVVCSVSTVVFNANPLMRYDGYYVLADWLEIPNLREKSNRFLSNLALQYCLGVEVQPEPYMAVGRKVLFVSYAIVSYIYRWVVTFGVLWFMYHFLQPYKLQVVSTMLALASLASMIGWPIYRLGKNIYRRGRLPDMKQWRVLLTGSLLAGIVLFAFLVPVPFSGRIAGIGLVQAYPERTSRVFLRYPGTLDKLNVRDGQTVVQGEVLAEFSNRELDAKIDGLKSDVETYQAKARTLTRLKNLLVDQQKKNEIILDVKTAEGSRDQAATELRSLQKIKAQDLVLLAPRDGVISGAPRIDDVGKSYEAKDPTNPFCVITDASQLRVCLPVVTPDFQLLAKSEPTPEGSLETGLPATIRVQGRDSSTWQGKVLRLPQSEAREVPPALTSRYGGPVAVKGGTRTQSLVPQTQHFLVYVEVLDPGSAISPGSMAQVKIHAPPQTCAHWVWRKINDLFDLGLLQALRQSTALTGQARRPTMQGER